ncbi:MAG: hypothetical protein V3S89_13980 [Desulfobacterales bacterium]
MEEKKINAKKTVDPEDLTNCESTQQMLHKARRDGVEIAFDRAVNMKACVPSAQIQHAANIAPWALVD